MERDRSKTRARFVASVASTLALVCAAVILCWAMYSSVERNLFDSTVDSTLDTLDVVRDLGVESVDTQLRAVKTDVKSLTAEYGAEFAAALDAGSDSRTSRISSVLAKLQTSPFGKDFWFLASDGMLVGADGSSPSWDSIMPQADAVHLLEATYPQVIGPDHTSEGDYVMAVCAPLAADGATCGLLVERFDGRCVSDWISSLRFDLGGGVTYLVDGTGRNIAASREENYDWFETGYNATELASAGDEEAAGVAAVEQRALEGETGRGSYGWGGGSSYMSYGPLREADWAIFVGFYGGEMEAHVNEVVARSGGIAQACIVALVALLGAVAIMAVRSLSRQRTANDRLRQQKQQIEQQKDALLASEARFRVALEKTGNIVFDYDIATGDIQRFITPEDALRCDATVENLRLNLVADGEVEDDSLHLFCDALDDLRHGAHRAECMLEVRGRSGEKLWYRASLSTVSADDGKPLRAIGVIENVTKEREGEYDSLTGLLDRKAAFEAAHEALAEAEPDDRFAFVMIDVDRFKVVNDTFGHPVGDEALQRVARVLSESFGESDVVARYGGDEFCVFCSRDVSRERLEASMEHANARLGASRQAGCEPGALSCSFGVSMNEGRGLSFDRLQTDADRALYAAKRAGRCTFAFFGEL